MNQGKQPVTEPEILAYRSGEMDNVSYLFIDLESREAAVIDPSFDPSAMLRDLGQRGIRLRYVLLTHAHFDHLAGVRACVEHQQPAPIVALHGNDVPLYRQDGGAALFGWSLPPLPSPGMLLADDDDLPIGQHILRVWHTPGHSAGHVVFYSAKAGAAFCGDLIFAGSIGRTDLPGGSMQVLLDSIRRLIEKLPPPTRLLCGHGPETTLAQEMASNPFLVDLR